MNYKRIARGEIIIAELEGKGSQQTGIRPVIIYSNDINNMFSPTLNVIPLTAEIKDLCVHFIIEGCGLKKPSVPLPEQITTINKNQLRKKIGMLSNYYIDRLDEAVDIQLGRRAPIVDPLKVA